MAPTGTFRPEPGVIALSLLGSLVVAGTGALMIYFAVDELDAWLAALALGLVLLGAWLACRSVVMRISFDPDSLHIVGILRSRRIPRTAVLWVEEGDLELPLVRWATPGAADRWSIMTPLSLGRSPFLPATMYLRRHRFLTQLRSWAPPSGATDIRSGVWSRSMTAAAQTMTKIWQTPALRVPLSVLLVLVAVGAYWLGVHTMIDAITNGTQVGRGGVATLAFAAFATEGAYWLLPLRRRHPRAWHIALGAALAPLLLLTIAAVIW